MKSDYFKHPTKYLKDKGIVYEPKIVQLQENYSQTKRYSFTEFFENLRDRYKKDKS
jgi:hypothetical protein